MRGHAQISERQSDGERKIWDSIGGVDGSLFGGAGGSVVNLVRRVPTSGTQSASNIRFLGKPCADVSFKTISTV